jgi:hypothetical protein
MKRLSVEIIAENENYFPLEMSKAFIPVHMCTPKEIFCHGSVSI